MRIATPQLVIEQNDSFEQDILNRKAYGEALIKIVTQTKDALVISLDGGWGEGKTTFVKMWQGLLFKSDIPSVYIDAFKNDYVDDAFITVISAITDYAEKNIKKSLKHKIHDLKETSKKVGCQLLSWTARVGVKAATLGIIKDADIDSLKDIKDDVSNNASDFIGKLVEERIASHSKNVEIINSFRKILSDLPSKLQQEGDRPLVIIIDELDRCKPTFAVEILEKIKHLFSVENVVFLLVMNKSQLEESIKFVYGQNIDAHTYLQKFVNIETKLPKNISHKYENDIRKYAEKLIKIHELQTWSDERQLIDCVESLSIHLNFSLRQLEKVFSNLAIFYITSSENAMRIPPIIALLAVVRVAKPSLFEDMLYRKTSYAHVYSELNLYDLNDDSDRTSTLQWIMKWIKYGLMNEDEFAQLSENDDVKIIGNNLWQYHVRRENIIEFIAKQISIFTFRS